jgi:hypothetical protein
VLSCYFLLLVVGVDSIQFNRFSFYEQITSFSVLIVEARVLEQH